MLWGLNGIGFHSGAEGCAGNRVGPTKEWVGLLLTQVTLLKLRGTQGIRKGSRRRREAGSSEQAVGGECILRREEITGGQRQGHVV